jgi:hypothetical protein
MQAGVPNACESSCVNCSNGEISNTVIVSIGSFTNCLKTKKCGYGLFYDAVSI